MDREEFERLSQGYLQGSLEPAEHQRLAAYLEQNEKALREFVEQLQLHQTLHAMHTSDVNSEQLVKNVKRELRYERESAVFSRAVVERVQLANVSRTRRRMFFAAAAAAACVLLALFLSLTGMKNTSQAEIARVQDAAPGVELTRNGKASPMTAGMMLESGDRITTPASAGTTVQLTDSTRVVVGAETNLTLLDVSGAPRLSVDFGNVALSVTKRSADKALAVVTQHATAQVLGTQFTVTANGVSTTLTVTEGRVRFTRAGDGKQLEVTSGQSVVSADGVAFEIRDTATVIEPPVKPSGHNLLFVVGKTPLSPGDEAVVTHLRRRGHVVRTIASTSLTSADVAEQRCMLISSTVLVDADPVAAGLGRLLKYSRAAILTWEPRLFPELGMTADDEHGTDWGTVRQIQKLNIVRPEHPVAAGLSGVVDVTAQPAQLTWGKVSERATLIATLEGHPKKAAIFVYPRETPLAEGSTAQGARAGFFLFDSTSRNLNAAGWTLFDSVCDWCLGQSADARPIRALD